MSNKLYAQIDVNGVVFAVSELSGDLDLPDLIPLQSLSDCNLGDTFLNGEFVRPEIVTQVITQITVGAFRRRLTLAEKIAVKTSSDPVIQVFNDDLMSLTYVDIKDPELLIGLQYMASENLLELTPDQTNDDRITELLRVGTQQEAV